MFDTLFFGLIVSGLIGGAILGSSGITGPFLVPALLILGFSSGVARGTYLLNELLMTIVGVIGFPNHQTVKDKKEKRIMCSTKGS